MTSFIIGALVVLFLGFSYALVQKDDIQGFTLTLTAAMSLAISVLVFPYYIQNSDLPIALIESFRSGVSGIALGVDGDIPYALQMDEGTFRLYRFLLYSLYILGPLASSFFLLTFSAKIKAFFSFLFLKRFHIFSDFNERSFAIASSLAETKGNGVIVFANCDEVDNTIKNQIASIKGLRISSSPEKIHLLKRKKYEFYEIDEDPDARLMETAALCERLIKQKNYTPENVIVRVFGSIEQREVLIDLDEQYADKIYLRHIDEGASLSLSALSLNKDLLVKTKDPKVWLLSDDPISLSLLEDLVCLLIKPDSSYQISYIGNGVYNFYQSIAAKCQDLSSYPIKVLDCRYGQELENVPAKEIPDLVFVIYKNDKTAYETAKLIKRHLSSLREDLSCPPIYCRIGDEGLQSIVKDDHIHFFGKLSSIYSYDQLINPTGEKAAARVHLSYLSSQNEGADLKDPAAVNKALQESGFYRIHNQESSYAQALALQYKKAYILSFKKDESISDEEFIDQWLDEEKNMKKMADSEHDRWSAYQILHGWKTADEKQTAAIIAKYEGKRANDPKLRLHPAIVANSKLKKTEDMVNRLFKQYGSNKTVNYLEADRGIIAKINYILKDK